MHTRHLTGKGSGPERGGTCSVSPSSAWMWGELAFLSYSFSNPDLPGCGLAEAAPAAFLPEVEDVGFPSPTSAGLPGTLLWETDSEMEFSRSMFPKKGPWEPHLRKVRMALGMGRGRSRPTASAQPTGNSVARWPITVVPKVVPCHHQSRGVGYPGRVWLRPGGSQ